MEQGKVLRRRGLIAGMAAVAAGVIAAKTADSVSASDGDNPRIGIQNVNTHGMTHLSAAARPVMQGCSGSSKPAMMPGWPLRPQGSEKAINATSFKKNGVTSYTNIAGSAYAGVQDRSAGGLATASSVKSTGGGGSYGVWGKTDSRQGRHRYRHRPRHRRVRGRRAVRRRRPERYHQQQHRRPRLLHHGLRCLRLLRRRPGVFGTTTAPGNAGLAGLVSTPGTAAFAGTATVPTAFAGFFTGDVFVNGNFTVLDPTGSTARSPIPTAAIASSTRWSPPRAGWRTSARDNWPTARRRSPSILTSPRWSRRTTTTSSSPRVIPRARAGGGRTARGRLHGAGTQRRHLQRRVQLAVWRQTEDGARRRRGWRSSDAESSHSLAATTCPSCWNRPRIRASEDDARADDARADEEPRAGADDARADDAGAEEVTTISLPSRDTGRRSAPPGVCAPHADSITPRLVSLPIAATSANSSQHSSDGDRVPTYECRG